MSVSDVDNLGRVETVTLSVTEGTLTVTAGTSGATVQGSGSNSVTITGTLAQINALLNTDGTSTVSYIDNTDTPSTSTTLTLSINDSGNTGTGGASLTGSDTAIINITAVNDAPVATIAPTTYSAAGILNLKNSGMSVSDVDSLGRVETVTLSVTEGALTVAAGTSGAVVSGSGTSTVTITGTLAQINTLLNTDGTSTVSYIDNISPPSPSATLTLSINDNGNTGTGGVLTSSDTATINIAFLIAPGEVLVLKGDTLTNPLIENDGTIQTGSNNTSNILGSITGTGVIEIANNSTLRINGSVGSGQTILFSVDPGGGANTKLVLGDPSNFHAKILDFQGNDQIDLINFVPTTITWVDNAGTNTGGALTISNGITTAVITFADGDYTIANFKLTSDGNGGTLISDPPTSTTTSDATVIPVAETPTLTATTADTQTNAISVAVDDDTVVALNIAGDPDGGEISSVTISGTPSDVTPTDGAGDKLAVTNGTITLSQSELTGLAPSSQDEIITPSVAAANSRGGWTAAKTLAADVNSHTTHREIGSDDNWTTASSWISSGPSGPTSSDDALVDASGAYTVSIDGAAVALSLIINGAGATAVDSGSLTLNGALTVDAGAFQLAIEQQRKRDDADGRHGDRANWNLQAASISIGAAVLFLVEHGNCAISEAATHDGSFIVENDIAGILSGSGLVTVNSDAALKFSTISHSISGVLADSGMVEVTDGRLEIAGTASGTGVLALQLDGDDAVNVTFAGPTGELILKDPAHFTGTISGLTGSDEIDLTNINSAPARVSSVGHDSSSKIRQHTDTVKLAGDYTGSAWTLSDDGHGGAVVVHPPTSAVAAQSLNTAGATVTDGGSLTLGGAASQFLTDHLHFGDANTGNYALEPQSLESQSQPPCRRRWKSH
jgi:hypothetical protein